MKDNLKILNSTDTENSTNKENSFIKASSRITDLTDGESPHNTQESSDKDSTMDMAFIKNSKIKIVKLSPFTMKVTFREDSILAQVSS